MVLWMVSIGCLVLHQIFRSSGNIYYCCVVLLYSESEKSVDPLNGFLIVNTAIYTRQLITYDSLKVCGSVWFITLMLH
jgi:hypothetical protein